MRGQLDCQCKEGCKGDPFKKCDCDLPNPANETQADPGNKGTATIQLLALTAIKTRPSKMATKSGLRFWIWASQVQYFAPKITDNGRFRVQKNGTWDAQIQKRRPLFFRQLSPNMVE